MNDGAERMEESSSVQPRAVYRAPAVEFSVIIPTQSPQAPLEACVESLIHQSFPPSRYEIIVVDTSGNPAFGAALRSRLARFGDRVRVLSSPRKLGYAAGCRLGVSAAQGAILAFHNDDALVDPAWVPLAIAAFRNIPDLGVATCRVVDADKPRVQHEGAFQTHAHGLFWHRGYGEMDAPLESRPPMRRELDSFGGVVWATSRRVWEEVGGLSDAYRPGYYEDTEFALRCRQKGYRIQILPEVTCSHFGSLTLGYGSRRFWRAFHRSRYLFLIRNRTGYSCREMAASELKWWWNHAAGHRPLDCLMGALAALMAAPVAFRDRKRWQPVASPAQRY